MMTSQETVKSALGLFLGIVITSEARNLLFFAAYGAELKADPSGPRAVRDDNFGKT
jgi:hypothetical protein